MQRYGGELQQSLPEVDAFLGTGDFTRFARAARRRRRRTPRIYGGAAHLLPDLTIPRVRTGHFFSAYLKVSEGCDHTCSFCIIPKIRGRHESRPLDSVLAEAAALADDGVVELNLIAQDLTAYGRDRRDGTTLSGLLRELVQIDGLRWIRLLYNYPRYVTDELLDTIAAEEKICSYIDMPLQHISDRMLRAMRRERDGATVRRLIQRIRERIPGVAIRTAFIVGFPGETDADFAELLEFVRDDTLRARRRVSLLEGRRHGGGDAGRAGARADQAPAPPGVDARPGRGRGGGEPAAGGNRAGGAGVRDG